MGVGVGGWVQRVMTFTLQIQQNGHKAGEIYVNYALQHRNTLKVKLTRTKEGKHKEKIKRMIVMIHTYQADSKYTFQI